MLIRPEQPRDLTQIRTVNTTAFGRPDEADLIDNLRAESAVLLSLVAELDNQLVGHILFNRMTIETPEAHIPAVSLAPVAVLPTHQRRGAAFADSVKLKRTFTFTKFKNKLFGVFSATCALFPEVGRAVSPAHPCILWSRSRTLLRCSGAQCSPITCRLWD